jgi:hypothetical protein
MIIITVKEAALLLAVDAVVGGVEVEDKVFRRRRVRGNEQVDEDLGDLDQSPPRDAVFQATEGGRRRELPRFLGRCSNRDLKRGINTQSLMIVEVFISQCNCRDPLSNHHALVVDHEFGLPRIGNRPIQRLEEPDLVGDRAEQERPRVGGEPAALKISDDGLGAETGKREGVAVTVCHGGGLAREGCGECANPYPITSKAIAPFQILL